MADIKDGDIVVIDRVEDDSYDGKDFKKVTDKAGNKFNVKSGRGGALKEKWPLLQEGVAIKLQVGEYNDRPFVKDFAVVKDEFVAKAATVAQTQVKTDRNDSIEAQVGQKGGIEVLKCLIEMSILNETELQECTEYAMASVRWGMGRVDLPSVIVAKIEEAKGETKKSSPKAQTKPPDKQDSGGATDGEPENAGALLNWIMSKDPSIKAPRLWIQTGYGITDKEILTTEKCGELYNQIKADKEW